MTKKDLEFITGARKLAVYCRVAIHVALHFLFRVPPHRYPVFLYRVLLLLLSVRHNKIVRWGKVYKLQLYMPAYPTKAFFHALAKFHRAEPGSITVVMSMTRACTYKCPHCYQGKDGGRDLEMDKLVSAARSMQEMGTSMFDIEGGEPLIRFDRLEQLLAALDDRAEKWINTTGYGLTDEKLDRLEELGLFGVMVSIHSPDPGVHDRFTGVDGSFETAVEAIRKFRDRGILAAINCCLSAEAYLRGELGRVIDIASETGCAYIQVIHTKASGNLLASDPFAGFTEELFAEMRQLHLDNNSIGGSGSTALSIQVFEEDESCFGCTAGGVDRFYLGSGGEVQPCEFLNISFGNVNEEPFEKIFARMRSYFSKPCADWLCCTQAGEINRLISESGTGATPLRWEHAKRLVEKWNRGKETRLYRRMGIYR